MNKSYPSITQANLMFFSISITILIGSILLSPRIGMGSNLWINEYLWILAPTLLLVKLYKMPTNEVFKLNKLSKRNMGLSVLTAIGMWFFSFYISKVTGILLDTKVGTLQIDLTDTAGSLSQSILILLGMVILAPICEELLFRGVILSAYEQYDKKYGYFMVAILFGMFHILNGITEVIPTFLAGLMLGYLVYRTGSIAASMVAHMTFNLCAIFIGGGMGLTQLVTIPMWVHLLCISGLIISILILRFITPEANKEETRSDRLKSRYPIGGVVLLTLSIIFVVVIGIVEVYTRLAV